MQVHVDDYKLRVYSSLTTISSSGPLGSERHLSSEAPSLTGFLCGNKYHPGCLTRDEEGVRIHSCEKGNECSVIRNNWDKVVTIRPIVAHLNGDTDLNEVGTGGGGGDLNQEAELDVMNPEEIDALRNL